MKNSTSNRRTTVTIIGSHLFSLLPYTAAFIRLLLQPFHFILSSFQFGITKRFNVLHFLLQVFHLFRVFFFDFQTIFNLLLQHFYHQSHKLVRSYRRARSHWMYNIYKITYVGLQRVYFFFLLIVRCLLQSLFQNSKFVFFQVQILLDAIVTANIGIDVQLIVRSKPQTSRVQNTNKNFTIQVVPTFQPLLKLFWSSRKLRWNVFACLGIHVRHFRNPTAVSAPNLV